MTDAEIAKELTIKVLDCITVLSNVKAEDLAEHAAASFEIIYKKVHSVTE